MGHLEARATVRWSGWTGTVTGESGALAAPTATQLELGGPGGGTNPEELLAAAHANCFTSTLTALARARDLPPDEVATSVTTRLALGTMTVMTTSWRRARCRYGSEAVHRKTPFARSCRRLRRAVRSAAP